MSLSTCQFPVYLYLRSPTALECACGLLIFLEDFCCLQSRLRSIWNLLIWSIWSETKIQFEFLPDSCYVSCRSFLALYLFCGVISFHLFSMETGWSGPKHARLIESPDLLLWSWHSSVGGWHLLVLSCGERARPSSAPLLSLFC